jgi:hypothetical protein
VFSHPYIATQLADHHRADLLATAARYRAVRSASDSRRHAGRVRLVMSNLRRSLLPTPCPVPGLPS